MDNRTILLVEDNPDDVTLTIRALKKYNISNTLTVAKDGVEALDYLFGTGNYAGRDCGNVPALILLDLKLPRISGLEVLKRVRAEKRTALLPVVVLTSSREDCDIICSYELGANSYVRKPVDYNEFTEAICQLNLYWLVLNESPPVQRNKLSE